jgi:hypothetical protein
MEPPRLSPKAEELCQAFIDLMDGCSGWHEIHEHTGLPVERCKEIYALWTKVAATDLNKYSKK